MRIAFLLALLAFAPAAVAPATSVGIELTGCHYVESLNLVPGALVDPLVPPDFQVAGAVNLVVGMATCQAETVAGETGEVTFGWADVSVSPRAALRSPGISLYLYRIEHVTRDDLYGSIHAQLGAECRVMDSANVVVDLTNVHALAEDEGATFWDVRAPLGLAAGTGGGRTPYREYGPAVGGYAYLEGVLVDPGATTLPGSFLVAEESALAGVWGPAWASRTMFAPDFAIEGTTLGHVPWASAPAPVETC